VSEGSGPCLRHYSQPGVQLLDLLDTAKETSKARVRTLGARGRFLGYVRESASVLGKSGKRHRLGAEQPRTRMRDLFTAPEPMSSAGERLLPCHWIRRRLHRLPAQEKRPEHHRQEK